jgi:hypothetical protein
MKKKYKIVMLGIGTGFLFNNGLVCAYMSNSEIVFEHISLAVVAQMLINISITIITVMAARSASQ